MPDSKNIYESLLQQGYSKQEIDAVLHKLVLHQQQQKKKQRLRFSSASPLPIKVIQLLKRITATGLYLLKTQFAKKPKNPI